MLSIPPALLEVMQLQPGAPVTLTLEDGHLVMLPLKKPRYSLDELLAQCDPTIPPTAEDQAWREAAPLGNELL